jgi:hypothetical protein
MTKKRKLASAIILPGIFLALIAFGVYREEVIDVVTNATLICFSCVGIK